MVIVRAMENGVAKVKKQRSLPVLSRQAVAEVIVRAMENGVAKVKKQRSLPVLSRQAVAEVATGAMEYGVPKEEKVWAVRVRRHQGVAEDLVSRMKKKKCSPEVKNINWHQAVLQKTPHLANNRGYSINDPIEVCENSLIKLIQEEGFYFSQCPIFNRKP
ncbi:uncharacterized protein LOC123383245 isoform X5 [Felis catus]|uniref:uncharacterized protein LOC123383245 isoform X5 n=1 Tax=Felis catus TaxID=9685 RepID=UPI001D1A081D|nr:uncharacterized protein LOC123383245 isoform X5 [Felis catus]